jgi:midasin
LLQHLARLSGRELIVQNLSLQTDSTDLLGGYRPLEIHQIARKVYEQFVDLFVGTFSRTKNGDFLQHASSAFQNRQWDRLIKCFERALQLADNRISSHDKVDVASWTSFRVSVYRFKKQRAASDVGLAFVFMEGALVDAIRKGSWVLLDEINLATSETLHRLCGLLDHGAGSLILTEKGDNEPLERHKDFRLFAAMNPATDAGKKDLNPSIRARFTEIYVDELLDAAELRQVCQGYVSDVLHPRSQPNESPDVVMKIVELYLRYRNLAEQSLVDGSGQKPRFTLRTLTRAVVAFRNLLTEQKFSVSRAIVEGFELSFHEFLDSPSKQQMEKVLHSYFMEASSENTRDHPGRRPGGRGSLATVALVKPFWIKVGPELQCDWASERIDGLTRFVLTPSTLRNLRSVARAIASGNWPILLEGPTSAGKTTLVEYIAARCGHSVVRINNHEHTDISEYIGGFASDSSGSLSFQDGLLVRALKLGQWVILDELNLAPSEVLEALNRLLDDNRELYISEINVTLKPHPSFRLFATQNPTGAYGGRKRLSRAFRNRFVEIHVGDIPAEELITILERRCGSPPSHAQIMVAVMNTLRLNRSKTSLFWGKDGYITPRDLLRWALRKCSTKLELAQEGFMLLAERLRIPEERAYVRDVLESHTSLTLDMDSFYYGMRSEAREYLSQSVGDEKIDDFLRSVSPTKPLLRLITLVLRCVRHREPVLLVGGKK